MKKQQDANLEPNGDRNKSDCLYCCRDWSNNSLISLDLHIMQLTDCFNVYRTHLHGIAETIKTSYKVFLLTYLHV